MATTRVYILAKELGVKSSAIVKKCQDEGLDVKNHMAVISAGLAATIREWFSEGENVTTVETSEKVDLEKVRVKKKTKREPPAKEAEAQEAEKKPMPSVEQAPDAMAVATVIEPKVSEQETPTVTVEAGTGAAVVGEEPKAPAEPMVEVPKEPEPEPEPEPILPAGPILEKPEPARLSGPRVVRVEAPEPLRRPRPRQRARYDAPVTEPLMYSQQEQEDGMPVSGKDRRHSTKHHREKTHGRRRDEQDTETIKKAKLGGKWRQRDIEERRARLDAAGGEGLRARPMRKITAKSKQKVGAPARPQKAVVTEPITVKDLSAALAVKSTDIIFKLMQHDVMVTANQVINNEMAELVAMEFDTELVVEHKKTLEEQDSKKKKPVAVGG